MAINVEGILIKKIPYQDKHLIGTLLLRNGFKSSVIFYGGQGGGKKHKSSILQLGYLFSVVISKVNKSDVGVLSAKEYKEKWFHEKLASQPKAFYLLCFFCELLDKFSPQLGSKEDLDESVDVHEGLFRLLSNAIFYLERDVSEDKLQVNSALFVFLTKAIIELGIFPRTENCALSGEVISKEGDISLDSKHGGFSYTSLLNGETRKRSAGTGRKIREKMLEVAASKYGETIDLQGIDTDCNKELVEYLCFQQHINVKDFKSTAMLI